VADRVLHRVMPQLADYLCRAPNPPVGRNRRSVLRVKRLELEANNSNTLASTL